MLKKTKLKVFIENKMQMPLFKRSENLALVVLRFEEEIYIFLLSIVQLIQKRKLYALRLELHKGYRLV